jgi:tetratricopeptide (TPR) repeat protein
LIFGLIFITEIFGLETIEEIALGDRYYSEKKYDFALSHYLSALKQNPNSTKALAGHGNTSLQLGSVGDARKSFERLLQLNPADRHGIAGIGRVLVWEGKSSEARLYLEKELKSKPRDPIITLALVDALVSLQKPELALHKLEGIQDNYNFSPEVSVKLLELYFHQNQLEKAETLSDRWIKAFPDQPDGYLAKGNVNALKAYGSNSFSNLAGSYFEQALSNFETGLVLNPGSAQGRFQKAKLLFWRSPGALSSILDMGKMLLDEDKSNVSYSLFWANLVYRHPNPKSNDINLAAQEFRKRLETNDLDEITRFIGEEFSIRFLPEDHPFRKWLGNYRMERYRSEKNSLLYESSVFHLIRSLKLIPNSRDVRSSMMEYYRNQENLGDFIQQLAIYIRENPDDFKAKNRLEYSITSAKKSLEYREGFLDLQDTGLKFEETGTLPKVAILDFRSNESFPNKIAGAEAFRKAILESAKHYPLSIRTLEPEEETQLQSKIQSMKSASFQPYTNSHFFDLSETSTYPKDIRFIVSGTFMDQDKSLSLEARIYDRKTAKFSKTYRFSGNGRSSLATVSSLLAKRIFEFIPVEGKILKIKKDGIIVNLGTRNGLTKNSQISVYRDGKIYRKTEILEMGRTLTHLRPLGVDWERDLATGEDVIALPADRQ